MSISSTIKSIQGIMRKDVGVDGDAQRLSQLVWMLFLKIFDDRESEWELLQDDYQSPLPEKYRWRNWAANAEGMTGEALKQFLDNDMFPALQKLVAKGGDQRAYVIRSVFEDAYNYMKSGQLIRQVVNKIQEGVDFNKAQERHLFGDMYEQLLRDLQAAGNAGEFYTPRAVTEFMVRMVNPRLGEKVMDPACGTGGFLTCAIEHIRKQDVKTVDDEVRMQSSILGIEKKPMPHLLCTTNMILHGIDVPINIRHDNTLSYPLISWGPQQRVDVIVTNPPFGGMEEDGIETNFPAAFRTRETADLFLVLIMQMLKSGGRAALVLPDGFLFGEGIKTRIKEKLLENCNLHTIVRLPNGVFAPYTGIKTNLLFFSKGTPTQHIWFYEHPYPSGAKSYNKTKPMKIEEFVTEEVWWGTESDGFKDRVENERAWKVSLEDIKASNYNLDCKNPHVGEQEVHDPDLLLAQYNAMLKDIAALRVQLKDTLTQSQGNQGLTRNWQRTAGNFDMLFTTEASIESLKKTILQLAVMGKLVAQDVNDEPASELLKRLRLEKAKLVADGEIKKDKPILEIRKAEKPFDLPKNWEWIRVSEITKIVTSGSRDWAKYLSTEGAKFITMGNLSRGSYELRLQNIRYVNPPKTGEGARTKLEAFDVLCSITGEVGNLGRIPEDFGDAYINQHTCLLRFLSPCKNRYFPEALRSPMALMQFSAPQRGVKNSFRLSDLNDMVIPLPPLAEQHRIVVRVDELMAMCDHLKSRIVDADRLHQKLSDVLVECALMM
jgi:type I restriction enzyme M protein